MFFIANLLKNNNFRLLIRHVVRFKFKKKWATNHAEKLATDLALSHYDFHIGKKLADQWPSIRLALLSQPKHCAVLNNFCEDYDKFLLELAETGGFDFVSRFKRFETHHENEISSANKLNDPQDKQNTNSSKSNDDDNKNDVSSIENEKVEVLQTTPNNKPFMTSTKSDLYSFTPARRVLSDREKLQQLEFEMNSNDQSNDSSRDNSYIKIIEEENNMHIPDKLKAIVYSKCDVTKFKPAKRDIKSGKLSYYIMDGGSVLPILALDLFPNCHVLDMCAAPGGKTYAILQTMLPDTVTCLDKSYSRMVRLKDTMRMYFPQFYIQEDKVKVKLADACNFGFENEAQFDRVLVDVPCYADRHSIMEEENNWFKTSRQSERMLLQQIQQKLLISGVKSIKVGGIVVYSTCTLSPPQNDGTVRSAIEKLFTDHNIEVAVVDTKPLAMAYQDHFVFNYDSNFCSLGQLVLPNVVANFGPTYFCKLKRLK